ncbi:MAG: MoaD/ThiS family protein [Pseudobdellovibrio sp.]
MNVNLHLYGSFRQLGLSQITLDISADATVKDLRKSLEKYLIKEKSEISSNLIQASVFATNESILNDYDQIVNGMSVAILPPVCGG